MPSRSRGFPPIAAPDARVLILGSLPGQVSLAARQYYAQPQNAFWRIMGELCGAHPHLPYAARTHRLLEHRIALWDVCKAAHRPGSLDASIDPATIVVNDLARFYREHQEVRAVFTNGGTATRLYQRLVLPRLGVSAAALPLQPLPSTSPAHARMPFAQKLERWRAVNAALTGLATRSPEEPRLP
jgi:double-stranded uracil-DNA glycosylase